MKRTNEYLNIDEVLELANKNCGCTFNKVPFDKMLFQGRTKKWETVTLYTPKSKTSSKGIEFITITPAIVNVIDSTDEGLLIIRLEGRMFLTLFWSDIKHLLTPNCLRDLNRDGRHWRINMLGTHIEVAGNKKILPIELEY